MASPSEISAAIKSTFESVAGIGRVHDFERFATRESELKELLFDETTQRIFGWMFFRERSVELDLDLGAVRVQTTWRARAFMGWDDGDSTGLLFDAHLEAAVAAFRADPTLGGLVDALKDLDQSGGQIGLQIERIEPVMYAGMLCHRATCSLLTETTQPI